MNAPTKIVYDRHSETGLPAENRMKEILSLDKFKTPIPYFVRNRYFVYEFSKPTHEKSTLIHIPHPKKPSVLSLPGIILISIMILNSGCQINEPNLPSWDVGLNLPVSDKSYDIFDIIERSENIGIDSLNGNNIFIYGTSKYKRELGDDIEFDGIQKTPVKAPSVFSIDTSLVFDDSTFVRRADFLTGVLKFVFNNITSQDYSVDAVIANMFRVDNGDTVRFSRQVAAGGSQTVEIPLSEIMMRNESPDNRFRLRANFNSAQPVLVDFTYELSPYSIRSIEGRMRPLGTGKNFDEVLDPFGSDVPEGSVNFAYIVPNTNFLTLRRHSSNFQVDFSNISLVGENKNGTRIRLKYLRTGIPGDPLDSMFSLTLPKETDSLSFPINQDNSNILEFINNVPQKIILERTDYLNLSYEEGHLSYTDSLIIRFDIQVPLDVSITKPISFTDTADVGFDDEDLRSEMDKSGSAKLFLRGVNGLPLKGVVKARMLDSSYNELLPITFLVSNSADSTSTIGAAPVGQNGYTSSPRENLYSVELDSVKIQKLKRIGKIVYEYKLYTDPEQITPPRTTVRVRSTDMVKTLIYGNLKYRFDP